MKPANYHVIWSGAAEAALAELWLQHPSEQRRIQTASDAIDRALSTQPLSLGESREGNERICHIHPLAITYSVIPEDRLVRVAKLWWIDPRPDLEG